MDIQELIESGRVKITCSKCGNRFKGTSSTCPKCGVPWQVGDAISEQKKQTIRLEKRGIDITKHVPGKEVNEI